MNNTQNVLISNHGGVCTMHSRKNFSANWFIHTIWKWISTKTLLNSNHTMQQNYGGVCTIHSKYKIEPDWSLCFFHNVGNMIWVYGGAVVRWNWNQEQNWLLDMVLLEYYYGVYWNFALDSWIITC